jgi:hypothetical protein
VVGEFNGAGVWKYTPGTGWKNLATTDATALTMDSLGAVFADFLGTGVKKFDPVTGKSQFTTRDVSLLAAI